MGLLSILRRQRLKDKEIRVLMLGLDNSGKTTIVKAILKEDVKEVSPTLGFNIKTVQRDEFTLNIWDIGGQSTLRPFWYNYFEKTDSLIWVVDAVSLDRIEECRKELHNVLTEDRLVGANLLVFVNKLDLIPEEKREEVVLSVKNALDLDKIIGHNWKVIGCSAYTKQNLDKGLDWVIQEIKDRLYIL